MPQPLPLPNCPKDVLEKYDPQFTSSLKTACSNLGDKKLTVTYEDHKVLCDVPEDVQVSFQEYYNSLPNQEGIRNLPCFLANRKYQIPSKFSNKLEDYKDPISAVFREKLGMDENDVLEVRFQSADAKNTWLIVTLPRFYAAKATPELDIYGAVRLIPGFRSFWTFEFVLQTPVDCDHLVEPYLHHYEDILRECVEFHDEDSLQVEMFMAEDDTVSLKFWIPIFYYQSMIANEIPQKFGELVERDNRLRYVYTTSELDYAYARKELVELHPEWQLDEKMQQCIGLFVGVCYPDNGKVASLDGPDLDVRHILEMSHKLLNMKFRKLYIGCDIDMFDSKENQEWFTHTKETFTEEVEFFHPSKANIEKYFKLVFEEASGDQDKDIEEFVWFHFSGHGTSVLDDDGEEADGMDEALCPVDCDINGVIRDDFFAEVYMNPKYHETEFLATFDCCHSGTLFDLEGKTANGHDVRGVSMSGCQDDQTAANISANRDDFGAFTHALNTVIVESIVGGINPLTVSLDSMAIMVNNQFVKMGLGQKHSHERSHSKYATLGHIMFKEKYRNFKPVEVPVKIMTHANHAAKKLLCVQRGADLGDLVEEFPQENWEFEELSITGKPKQSLVDSVPIDFANCC